MPPPYHYNVTCNFPPVENSAAGYHVPTPLAEMSFFPLPFLQILHCHFSYRWHGSIPVHKLSGIQTVLENRGLITCDDFFFRKLSFAVNRSMKLVQMCFQVPFCSWLSKTWKLVKFSATIGDQVFVGNRHGKRTWTELMGGLAAEPDSVRKVKTCCKKYIFQYNTETDHLVYSTYITLFWFCVV